MPEPDSQEKPEGRNWEWGNWSSSTPSWEGPLRPRKGAGLSKDHTGVWDRTRTGIPGSCFQPRAVPRHTPKGPSITKYSPNRTAKPGAWRDSGSEDEPTPRQPPQSCLDPFFSPWLKLPNPIFRFSDFPIFRWLPRGWWEQEAFSGKDPSGYCPPPLLTPPLALPTPVLPPLPPPSRPAISSCHGLGTRRCGPALPLSEFRFSHLQMEE